MGSRRGNFVEDVNEDGTTNMDYENIPDTVKEVNVSDRSDAGEDDNRCSVVAKPLTKGRLSEDEFKEKYSDFQLNDEKTWRRPDGIRTNCEILSSTNNLTRDKEGELASRSYRGEDQVAESSKLGENISKGASTIGAINNKPLGYRTFREIYGVKGKSKTSQERGTHDPTHSCPSTNGSSGMNTTQEAQHILPVTDNQRTDESNTLNDPLDICQGKEGDGDDTLGSTGTIMKTLDASLFIDQLAENLQRLGIQQLLPNSFHMLYSGLCNDSAVSKPPYYQDIEKSYDTLRTRAQSLEYQFQEHICFPNALLESYLTRLKLPETNNFEHLPDKIGAAYKQLCTHIIRDFKERNARIMELESEAMESLISKSAAYYTEEMEYLIGDYYIDDLTFQRYAQEICKETLSIFRKVAGFKLDSWNQNFYETNLDEKLQQNKKKIKNYNEENKHRLESTISAFKNDSIREYKKALVKEKELREFNPRALKALDTLDYVGKDAKATATRHFQQQYKMKILVSNNPEVTQIICNYEKELEAEISTIFSSEVRDLKFKQVEQIRLLELKKKISSAERHLSVHPQNSKTSSQNISASGGHPSGHIQGSPYPSRNWPLFPFPRCQLAIHYGLYRTLAGIVVPGTDDILVLYDSQRNLPYKAFISNKETFMRLEGMIACLFAAIKLRTELDQKVEISDCVICIPQCLNENQRGVLLDSARIAGLGNVSLINDTKAIALAFMMENNLANRSFMVANTSEGFIDAAYFIVNEGVVTCTGVSGEFFSKMGGRGIIKGFLSAVGIDIILAGNDEYTNKIQRVLNSDRHLKEKHVIQVRDKYAIFGAAYLTVLNNINTEGPIYKRWANLSKEPTSDLEILWRHLLAQQYKDELLSLTNKKPLLPGYLSAKDMAEMQKHFILNEKIQIHRAKRIMLNKVQYLETCVNSNPRPGINELHGVIATIRDDLDTLDISTELLCDYDNNIDDLYDKIHLQSI
ncbi:unnamed protein product [Allacma fusca]|uniref:Uncharacterized protein n=1 Tax=Allacma fusca TaxID=39272 RepID=A0A8J2KY43_9HEXA|nr:unnamed protein product [Allacma fusca]